MKGKVVMKHIKENNYSIDFADILSEFELNYHDNVLIFDGDIVITIGDKQVELPFTAKVLLDMDRDYDEQGVDE